MILIKNGEVIARANKNRNLFTFDLAQPEKAMAIINKRPKTMAIIEQDQLTHLVSQNKRIQLWQPQLRHISNTRIVKVSKLVDGIDLNMKNKEYNPAKVLFNSDDSNDSNKFNPNNDKAPSLTDTSVSSPETAVIQQTTSDPNNFNKLYISCIGNKSSQTI